MNLISLCSAIRVDDRVVVPGWLHLLPAGEVRTIDGRGPYRVDDAAALVAASMVTGKLPIDENHAIDLAAPNGGAAPARGWIVQLEQRADGIWGRVEWTGAGRRIMADREYRGISPVIAHRKDGIVTAILRASLTNTPNLTGLQSLHAATRGSSAAALAEKNIRRRAEELQAECARAGLPIDLASAVASIKDEDATKAVADDGLDPDDAAIIKRLGLDRGAYSAIRNPSAPNDGLDADDVAMIQRLGIDRSAYAAAKSQGRREA